MMTDEQKEKLERLIAQAREASKPRLIEPDFSAYQGPVRTFFPNEPITSADTGLWIINDR